MTSEKRIHRAKHDKENPYYVASRDTSQDKTLSYDALGMLHYILSKPDDWDVQPSDLEREKCKRNKVYAILKELISASYIERIYHRDEKQRVKMVEYIAHEKPLIEKPLPEKQKVEKPKVEKRHITEYREKQNKENTLDAGKPRRELDPEFELIADIWHTRAGGYVANMKGMIFGTRKVKGEWLKCQFDPPATVEELTAFKPYMQSRIAEKRMTEPPTAAVTIQRWFYDFRAMREKQLTPVSPPVFDLSDWYIPELEPLK